MTAKEIAKELRSAASAIEHGRSVTFRKKLVAVAKDVNLWPGDGDSSAFARVATAAVKEARSRTNKLADSLLEDDADLGPAMDAALDAVEQVLQKHAQGTVWAGKYEPLQLSALFEQHIRTHLCEELIAIAEYGDYKHWLEAGKPNPSFDHKRKGAHITYDGPHGEFLAKQDEMKPLRRRYFAIVPSWSETRARTIDVVGGNEKDSAGMDAALKYAHKALGKSVQVKLVPLSDTKPNVTITL